MNRFLVGLAVTAVALTPAVADAKRSSKPKTTTFKGTLLPIHADQLNYSDLSGRAKLVDGKKNDKLTIHRLRGLQPGATYTWHLHRAAGATKLCDSSDTGEKVAAFGEGTFKASDKGRASAQHLRARGKGKWTADRNERYYVTVHAESGEVVLCGVLKSKKAKKPSKKGSGKKPASPHQHGKHRKPAA